MKRVNILLYEDFTALDAFGPAEVLSSIEEYELHYVSEEGGMITNKQNIRIETECMSEAVGGILLIPGGFGSRTLVNDEKFIKMLSELIRNSEYVLCVCTGAALAAKTGALDGRNATSNKSAFDWVRSCGKNVKWNRKARWVTDGNFYTSAGVSAGIDMAAGFVRDQFGLEKAEQICKRMEYHWHDNADFDEF